MANLLSHEILSESKSARNGLVVGLGATDAKALETLNKAKALVMALWNGTGYATTDQVAAYYEVTVEAVKMLLGRNEEEFFNEVKKLTGKDLQDARNALLLPSKTSQALAWTVRGMLRVGLMLTQSEVARSVRDVVLNVAESVKPQAEVSADAVIDEMRVLKFSFQDSGLDQSLVNGIVMNYAATRMPQLTSAVNERHRLVAATTDVDLSLTPTTIGEKLGISGRKVNLLLTSLDLQIDRGKQKKKGEPRYVATEAGKQYAHNSITTGKVGDNTDYQHLKWSIEVIDVLRSHLASSP